MQPQRSSFSRSFLFIVVPVLAAAAVGAVVFRTRRTGAVADLERQLAVAQGLADGDSVIELSRRLLAQDRTVPRRLQLAEALLAMRRFDELESALAELLRASPGARGSVRAMQARAAEAQEQPELALARWNELLGDSALPAATRVAALDRVVALLLQLGRLDGARARLDERLALRDGAAPRLVRVQLAVRLRQWNLAREDCALLRATSAADPLVKDVLPAWERVERALAASPDFGVVAPGPESSLFRAAGARALAEARLGLWQNVAADLRRLAPSSSGARFPAVLAAWLLGRTDGDAAEPDARALAQLPWLASSPALASFAERADGRWKTLEELLALDGRLAAAAEPAVQADLAAERARLVADLGLPALALRDAAALLGPQPGFLAARRVEIQCLLAQRETVRAGAAVDLALAQRPAEGIDAELERLAGLVRQAQGRHADAVEHFTMANDFSPRADLVRARAASLRFLQRFAEALSLIHI